MISPASTRFVLLIGTLLAAAVAGRAEVIEQILVKVNGEVFTKTDLETRQIAALRQSGRLDSTAKVTDSELRKMLDEMTPQLIVGVVDEILLVQRGKELGYRLSDEQFQSVVDSLKKDNKIESDEQFQAALKQENLTMADLRRNLERQMIVDRVRQSEVLGKVAVSEDEARRYYDSHLGEFTAPTEVTLREILVTVQKSGSTATAAEDAAALAKATSIRERVLQGEPVEKLASELSDAPSRANAGMIGPLRLEEVSADLRSLIDKMKVGDITQLLKTPTGYQILKLEARTDSKTTSFEEARDRISDRVFTDKRQGEYDKYLVKLRSQAIVEWKNPDVKKAYDQGLEQIKAGTPSPPSQ
jgi:peptidyl-prolyl cis-trans isomerase SurA